MNKNNIEDWDQINNALLRRSERLVHNVSPPSDDEREKLIQTLNKRRSKRRIGFTKLSIGKTFIHLGALIAAPRLVPAPALLAIIMLTSTVMISSNQTSTPERVFRGNDVSVYESSNPVDAATNMMIKLTKNGINFEVVQKIDQIDIYIKITSDNKEKAEKIIERAWSTDDRIILRYLPSPQ